MKVQKDPLSGTKKRIIETAGKIFADVGFENATVREICSQAGVNIAAINYHFRDKKGLYFAVLKYGKDVAFEEHPLDEVLDKPSPPEERLKIFLSWYVGRVRECHEGEFLWIRKWLPMNFSGRPKGLIC
jgi:AcrR family transcriptional regulator